MNKNLFRIVFNAKRGQLMAVAETACAQGKAASGESAGAQSTSAGASASGSHIGSQTSPLFRMLSLCIAVTFGVMVTVPTQAQIRADSSAPRSQQATVLAAPNGVPLINIQTPSAAGVSRNVFTQFDVQRPGAVLNNSRTNVQTQLGGWVQGNPWLATGGARVILNEINSVNPSYLNGYVEVAGQRAEVIIANPAGINVNGGGFINASGVTLTTGTPVMSGGSLDSYRVQRGQINIDGAGLDTSSADYTGIMARAVKVNAGIWAKDLQVVTGANAITAASRGTSGITPTTGEGPAPAFALDVSQLGGMYAGKITLVGTEAGLGVTNAGSIGASAGQVVVQSNGMLTNSGSISAAGNVQLTAAGNSAGLANGIINTGTVYAQGDAQLTAEGNITNSSLIAAAGNVDLSGVSALSQISSGKTSVLAAGLKADGTLNALGQLSLNATQAVAANGQNLAASNLSIQSKSVTLADSKTSAANISATAATGDIDLSGAVVSATQNLTLNAAQTIRNDAGQLSAAKLVIQANVLSNVGGEIVQLGLSDLAINLQGNLDNSQGRIASNSAGLTLAANTLSNLGGKIEHAGNGQLALQAQTLVGTGGLVASSGALSITAQALNLDDAVTNAQKITVNAGTFSHRRGSLAQTGDGSTAINVTDLLTNSEGTIASNGNTQLNVGGFNNAGGTVRATALSTLAIDATGDILNTKVGQLQGTIQSGGALTVNGRNIDNTQGQITGGSAATVNASGQLINTAGLLTASQNVVVNAAAVRNDGGLIASANSTLAVTARSRSVDNTAGVLQASKDLNLTGQGLNNTGGVISGQGVTVAAGTGTFANNGGSVLAAAALRTTSGALTNDAGLIQAGGDMLLNTQGAALSNINSGADKGILGQSSITLQTGDLLNQAGFIGAAGDLKIASTTVTNNQAGVISSRRDVEVTANGVSNQSSVIQAGKNLTMNVGAGSVNNQQGLLYADQELVIAAAAVDNRNTLSIDPAAVKGMAGKSVLLNVNSLDNTQGAVRADQSLTIIGNNKVNNTNGLLSSAASLSVVDTQAQAGLNNAAKTQSISNMGGVILADSAVLIDSASLTGDGKVLSRGNLRAKLLGDYTHQTDGQLQAVGDVNLDVAGDLVNHGQLLAGNALSLSATNIDNKSTGEISSNTTSVVASNTVTNRGLINGSGTYVQASTINNIGTGRIYGDSLAIQAETLNNDSETVNGIKTAATIAARGTLDIGVTTLNNREGATIFSAGSLSIAGGLDANKKVFGAAGVVTNSSATIESLGNLSIAAASLNNTNAHFSYTLTPTTSPTQIEYFTNVGVINSSQVAWSAGFLVLTGSTYANPIYGVLYNGPNAYTYIPASYESGGGGDSGPGAEIPARAIFNYVPSSPIWAVLGVAAPTYDANTPPVDPCLDQAPSCAFFRANDVTAYNQQMAVYNEDLLKYQAVQIKLNELRTNVILSGVASYQNYRTFTETTYTGQADAGSKPAQILSAGNLTLNVSGNLTNDKSQIISGGTLNLLGQAVNNVGAVVSADSTRWGTAFSYGVTGEECRRNLLGIKKCKPTYGMIPSAYAEATPRTLILGIGRSSEREVPASVVMRPPALSSASQVTITDLALASAKEITQVLSTVLTPVAVPVSAISPASAASVPLVVRTAQPNLALPNSSLFSIAPNAAASYLIETDPRFASYRQWLSSDYMLQALGIDPAATQKRLGDGFYEQKLIREQVAQLTGRRFTSNFTDDESQYASLMQGSVTYAKAHNLRPGIALSAAQMAALTSDIVWLVEQTVTLPSGQTVKALVPRVYVRVKPGDLTGDGTLIAAERMNIQLSGDLTNSGTVAGRSVMRLSADNINNLNGRLQAADNAVIAKQDINNTGGTISANDRLQLSAGRDINVTTTTASSRTAAGKGVYDRTAVDRVAGLYVSNPNGVLLASAGRDINLTAALAQNQGAGGVTQLAAERNVNLATVQTGQSSNITFNAKNYNRFSATEEVGTQIQTTGNLQIKAGQDINARAANITSSEGQAGLTARRDVNLTAGQASQSLAMSNFATSKGFLSKKSKEERTSTASTTAQGTEVGGNTVTVTAGRDINVKGSSVIADKDVNFNAANNINVEAAQNTASSTRFSETKTKGVFSNGGGSLTIGKKQNSTDQKEQSTTAAASTVGSIGGNVNLIAGQNYR